MLVNYQWMVVGQILCREGKETETEIKQKEPRVSKEVYTSKEGICEKPEENRKFITNCFFQESFFKVSYWPVTF